jgi:hypothetical protein
MIRARSRRLRWLHAAVATLLAGVLLATNGPPLLAFVTRQYHLWQINRASYKRKYGHWSILHVPSEMRINAIHAILLRTGKVLIIAGSGNNQGNFDAGRFTSMLYDPATDTFKKIKTPYDMFCGGQVVLADGRVLIAGGVSRYEVLKSDVHYAAGVVVLVNHNADADVPVPPGTTFVAPNGQRYRSTTSAVLAAARTTSVRIGSRRRTVVVPSEDEVWVRAVEQGAAGVASRTQQYAIPGLPGGGSVGASSYSLTLGEQTFWGSRKAYVFDPVSERYEQVPQMNLARWYPTLVRLKDGNVLAVSGLNHYGQMIVGNTEEWSIASHRWQFVRALTKPFPTYPALFLTPDGNLFFTGANAGFGPATAAWRTPGIWNPRTNAFQPVTGLRDSTLTETAASVLLPPAQQQRYAMIGGGAPGDTPGATGRIDVVSLDHPDPSWHAFARLPTPTRYAEAVITPDDQLFISGGSREYRGKHGSDVLQARMLNPATGQLTRLADPLVPRDYHAEALLLPDGRIITLGGNSLYGNEHDDSPGVFEQRIAIYSPPYLYHGPRPALTSGPSRLPLGASGVFGTAHPAQIATARLIRPSASTHVTDLEQRSIALSIHRGTNGVSLTVPGNDGLVPPGWYMLFVTNRAGVPSVARWIEISGRVRVTARIAATMHPPGGRPVGRNRQTRPGT